jgi:hypothetical protein
MGGKYIQMQVYLCHFMRTAFKSEASKKQLGMNRPKKNVFTVHLYEEQTTKEYRYIKFPLVIYDKFQNQYIRRTQKAFMEKNQLGITRVRIRSKCCVCFQNAYS